MAWKTMMKLVACGASLWMTAQIFDTASFDGFGALIGTALLMWLLNLTVKPILKLLTVPVGCVTLGASYLLLDMLCVWLADRLIPGAAVRGFLPTLCAALLASLISAALKNDGKHKK